MSVGNVGLFALGKETTYGTPVTPNQYGLIQSASQNASNTVVPVEVTDGQRALRENIMGAWSIDGGVTLPIRPEGITPHLFIAAMCPYSEVSSARVGATTAYDHTINITDAALDSFTLHFDGGPGPVRHQGCKFTGWDLSLAPESLVNMKADFLGQNSFVSDKLVPSFTSLRALYGYDITVSIAGSSDLNVETLDINFANNLELVRTLNGQRYGQKITELRAELGGSFTVEHDSLDYLKRFLGSAVATTPLKEFAQFALVVTITSNEEIESGYPYSITINIPLVTLVDGGFPSFDAGTRVTNSFSWVAEAGAGELVTVTIRNSVTSYA